jgi:hypothetical protein
VRRCGSSLLAWTRWWLAGGRASERGEGAGSGGPWRAVAGRGGVWLGLWWAVVETASGRGVRTVHRRTTAASSVQRAARSPGSAADGGRRRRRGWRVRAVPYGDVAGGQPQAGCEAQAQAQDCACRACGCSLHRVGEGERGDGAGEVSEGSEARARVGVGAGGQPEAKEARSVASRQAPRRS